MYLHTPYYNNIDLTFPPPIFVSSVPPALPSSKPYVSDIGDESLRLSWKPADIPKALKGVSPTSYRIEVQELPKQDWQTLVSYIPDTTYRLTDLRPRQDYNFRIRAENEFGLSEPSRPFYLPRATSKFSVNFGDANIVSHKDQKIAV